MSTGNYVSHPLVDRGGSDGGGGGCKGGKGVDIV